MVFCYDNPILNVAIFTAQQWRAEKLDKAQRAATVHRQEQER